MLMVILILDGLGEFYINCTPKFILQIMHESISSVWHEFHAMNVHLWLVMNMHKIVLYFFLWIGAINEG